MTSKIIVNNIESDTGVSTVTFNSNISVSTATITNINTTRISGVSTAGITTAYIGAINDGPISGARNRIINGDCRIDQRYAGASAQATDGGYFIDRWSTILNNGNFSVQGNAANITPPVGFTSYFGATVTTAASITGTSGIRYKIEGYNIADFAWGTSSAKTVTMSFWVYSSLTGSFGGAIWNSAQSYSYPFLYTVSQANTWTYITLTIPGSTNGTWLSTNGVGMGIDFSMGTAGTPLGTAGAWVAGYKQGATGQVNHLSTLGATLYITGLQVELGTVATPFERRSYGQELALAQRYYCKSFNIETAPANGITTGDGEHQIQLVASGDPHIVVYWPVIMRSSPIVTLYNPRSGGASGQWSTNASDGANARSFYVTPVKAMIDNSDVSLSATYWRIAWSASAEL